MKFKVGDRVIAVTNWGGNRIKDKTGTVIFIRDFGHSRIGVAFDEDIGGHDCEGHCTRPHGWFCDESSLKLLANVFKVGDRVRAIKAVDKYEHLIGKTGTIVSIDYNRVGVDFDESFGLGHNCGGKAKESCGRFGAPECFELLKEIEAPVEERSTTVKLDLPPKFAYVARDKDGLLFCYVDKPKRDVGGTQWYGERFKKINDSLLPDLKWTDEPLEVKK